MAVFNKVEIFITVSWILLGYLTYRTYIQWSCIINHIPTSPPVHIIYMGVHRLNIFHLFAFLSFRFPNSFNKRMFNTNCCQNKSWWGQSVNTWRRTGQLSSIRGIQFAGLFMIYPISKNLLFHTANCEKFKLSHKSRVSSTAQHMVRTHEPRFSWYIFNELIQPDMLLLILATVCAFCVAIVNIKIPIALGELVNTISDIIQGDSSTIPIFDKLYEPCMALVWKYLLQSTLTFVYICSLSSFGERLAARMRKKLFQSLMEQDIVFFDGHKTGGIISRFVFLSMVMIHSF